MAVIVPEKPVVEKWAAENGVAGSFDEIINNEKTNKYILDEIKKVSKEAGVSFISILNILIAVLRV